MPELAKVLIVDDEPDVLDLLERSLGLDYQVFRANGGSEGLELVWQHRFAVIITDQRMPDMSGVEFLERTIEYLPDTIRIILTGYTGVEDLIGAINAGRVYRYFTKPWEPRELEITVRRAVETYQLICERAQLLIELRHKVDDLAAALAREERVRAVFQKYVPAEVVNHVLAQEGEPGLIGERREVTVLFSDLRGFTSLVEQADPQWVVQEILTPYLGELGAVVMEHGGIIDKYLGDGLLAVFGAPLEHGDDPLRAVLAALEMRRRAEQLNGRGLGWDMKVGISIDTGVAIVGNIGSQRRMEYTVVGDVVNSASRVLQAGVRGMPNGILIGQRTFEQVCHAIAAREGEPLSVPGRSGRLRVYEVLGPKSGVQ